MNRDPDPYRLYAVIRQDLQMTPGKIAAQTGHAYLDTYLQALSESPEVCEEYHDRHGIKIAMQVKKLHHLERIHNEAKEAGIPTALITDLGYYGVSEELQGQATVTAVGIGPAKRGQVEKILKRARVLG